MDKVTKKDFFPDLIRNLPEADISFEGIQGWISQGEEHQIVFFDIEPVGVVPKHSHCAQWGTVLEGEMQFTIAGVTKIYKKGDSYFIPEGVVHSASFTKRTWVMDFFADKARYKLK
ncbi:MAG: cupin domain-containing protein [Candidatus Cloacimonetes bacterium]|nr:cupin domain-containing protein [Candidatus Cloacimonadota bacterium]